MATFWSLKLFLYVDQVPELIIEESSAPLSAAVQPENHLGSMTWLAGESQDVDYPDLNSIEESLLCREENISSAFLGKSGINNVSYTDILYDSNNMKGINSAPCGISDLENLELDTPPDFSSVSIPSSFIIYTLLALLCNSILADILIYIMQDLQTFSGESLFDWIDRI